MKPRLRQSVMLAAGLLLAACAPSDRRSAAELAFGEPPAGSFGMVQAQAKFGRFEEILEGAEVSKAFFEATRMTPVLGRAFVDADFAAAAEPVVIIHHETWQARFGGAPSALGSRIDLNGRQFTIVGVTPVGYNLPVGAHYWLPKRAR